MVEKLDVFARPDSDESKMFCYLIGDERDVVRIGLVAQFKVCLYIATITSVLACSRAERWVVRLGYIWVHSRAMGAVILAVKALQYYRSLSHMMFWWLH